MYFPLESHFTAVCKSNLSKSSSLSWQSSQNMRSLCEFALILFIAYIMNWRVSCKTPFKFFAAKCWQCIIQWTQIIPWTAFFNLGYEPNMTTGHWRNAIHCACNISQRDIFSGKIFFHCLKNRRPFDISNQISIK
jgi:hypothetical protein